MAAKFALALALAISPLSSAAVVGRGQAFLGNGMQPEVVARTLSSVEDEWKAQAAVFADCSSTASLPGASLVNCADAPSSFGKSCGTVVNAIIQGSGGDKDVAKEYMADVCSQKSISGWHQQQCHTLALAVRGSMSADKYANRIGFDSTKLCSGFWSNFLDGEKQRIEKEKAEREAAEKKEAEEAAEEEKKLQEKRKKEAEQKKLEEAERAKEEAKAKAAEAAAKVAQKKAEAEAVQEAAKKKMAEAAAAEAEHKKAVDKQIATTKAAETKAPVEKAPVKPEAKPAAKPVAAAAVPAAKPVVAVAVKEAPAAPKAAEPVAAKPAAAKPAAAKPAAKPAAAKVVAAAKPAAAAAAVVKKF